MILSANQPYFLPYFPWWQLIAQADLFLIGDDYAFKRHGWISRNRILINGQVVYFRIPIRDMSCNRTIAETERRSADVADNLRMLAMAYHKAPFFAYGYALAERIFSCKELNLSRFLTHSIHEVCDYLGIRTPLGLTSSLEGNARFRREERIYDFCRRNGADIYVNAIGGRELYDKAEFAAHGIELRFLQTEVSENLSIIDTVMHHSRDELHEMLGRFRYV
jgi:hypothetical protein